MPSSAESIQRTRVTPRWLDVLLGAVLIAWALALYTPWVNLPHPVSDMPEILRTLERPGGIVAGTADLVRHYANEGRFMPGSMAGIATLHEVSGLAGGGWRWMRFAMCALVVLGTYAVFRVATLGPWAAALGAGVFIVADAARPAWLMPQVMEPLGTLFVLGAVAIAFHRPLTEPWWRRSAAFALLIVAAIWVKEPFVAAIPFLLLLALTWSPSRGWRWPGVRPAVRLAGIVGGAVLVLNVIPILMIRSSREASGYAARYGGEGLSVDQLSNAIRASTLPVTRVPWFPANIAAMGLVALALIILWKRKEPWGTLVAIALSLPLAIAVIYAPWPDFPGYYAYPALVGIGLILAVSFHALMQVSRRLPRLVATALGGAVLLMGSLFSQNAFSEYAASRGLESRVTQELATRPRSTALVLGTSNPERSGSFGRALNDYAQLFHGPTRIRHATDVTCDDASLHGSQADTVILVTFLERCELFRGDADVVWVPFSRRDWKTWRRSPDSLGAVIRGAP